MFIFFFLIKNVASFYLLGTPSFNQILSTVSCNEAIIDHSYYISGRAKCRNVSFCLCLSSNFSHFSTVCIYKQLPLPPPTLTLLAFFSAFSSSHIPTQQLFLMKQNEFHYESCVYFLAVPGGQLSIYTEVKNY